MSSILLRFTVALFDEREVGEDSCGFKNCFNGVVCYAWCHERILEGEMCGKWDEIEEGKESNEIECVIRFKILDFSIMLLFLGFVTL